MKTRANDSIDSQIILLQNLFQNTNNIILSLDLELRIISCNIKAEEIFHISANQIIQQNYFDICALCKIPPAFTNEISNILDQSKCIITETYINSNKDTCRVISWKITYLKQDGHPIGFLLIGDDQTRLKYVEKQVTGIV